MEELDDIFDEVIEPINQSDNLETIDFSSPADDIKTDDLFGSDDIVVTPENSILEDLLKSKGIEDSKVIILDENDEEQEVNFSDLTREEQLEILTSQEEIESEYDLDSDEIDLLNNLRENNLTIEQFLENYKQSIIEELGANQETQNYDIDTYDDQELFLLDLKNKYDLSDDELVKELEAALANPDLFQKKVDKLRSEYRDLENQYNQAQQQEIIAQKEQEYSQFSDKMVDVAIKTPEFYGIELDDDEKNEVLSFLLDLDDNGTSDFYKTLNDPKKLYEAAWFLRYGKESFDALKSAYESEISRLKKTDKPKANVVRKNPSEDKIKNINDLF